ncbi:MAG TPA: hypothetical protein VG838_04705 [Opitutaceae bacterium]|nr:hypothetical protein [Opitutaceae bacterium]
MKRHLLLLPCLALLAASLAFTALPRAVAADQAAEKSGAQPAAGQLVPVDDKTDAAWLATARAAYPMDTCSVSGDKLDSGAMGKPQEYVLKRDGQPDRLVRFCCKDCVEDFNKDMAKYLKMIDAAAAAKAPAPKT